MGLLKRRGSLDSITLLVSLCEGEIDAACWVVSVMAAYVGKDVVYTL